MTVLENDVKPVRKLKRPNKENTSSHSSNADNGGRSSGSHEGGPPSSKRPLLDMLNGYRGSSDGGGHHHHHHHNQRGNNGDATPESPVATLSNMGNTCFLNSVLYTLRFAPTFLHNLHHLYGELCYMSGRTNQNKAKTSSLGRNIGALSGGPSSRSTSSKDLLSLGAAAAAAAATTTTSSSSSSSTTSSSASSSVIINNDLFPKSKVQIVTEKLHELFITMHNLEMKESTEPYQPNALLQAIREANYIFEGNHQQDAHELLVYVLDNIRDTCDLLTQQVTQNPIWLADTPETTASSNNSGGGGGGIGNFWSVRRSWTKKPGKKKERAAAEAARIAAVQSSSAALNSSKEPLIGGDLSEVNEDDPVENGTSSRKKATSVNFVAEDFEGITLRRTTCLECECVTERKEPFYDIPVPIPISESEFDASINQPSEVFKKLCVTSEKLCDSNKYLCETCMRYNEARREVLFEKLPNLMVLQLKRFTTSSGGNLQKVNTYMPTPLELECFCETCCDEETPPPHRYQLCCVIMHLGGTMASGHYITYVKASEHYEDYAECTRNLYRNAQQHHGGGSLSASNSEKSLNILKYFKPRTLAGLDSKLQSSSKSNLLMNGVKMCRSVDCCTVKLNKNVMENSINSLSKKSNDYWNSHHGGGGTDDIWLECDDENVQAITSQALEEELSYKPNSTSTPYLLFYTKIRDSPVD